MEQGLKLAPALNGPRGGKNDPIQEQDMISAKTISSLEDSMMELGATPDLKLLGLEDSSMESEDEIPQATFPRVDEEAMEFTSQTEVDRGQSNDRDDPDSGEMADDDHSVVIIVDSKDSLNETEDVLRLSEETEDDLQADRRGVYATTEYDCIEAREEVNNDPLLAALPLDTDELDRVTHPNNRTSPGTDANTGIAGGKG